MFLSHSRSHYVAVPSCLATHWRNELDLQSRPLSTTIQEPAGIFLEFFIRYHPLNEDPLPVPPFDVTMILREFRGAFGLLLGKLAGPLLLHYFNSGLTGWNLPRDLGKSIGYETLCARKVRLSCSGLESCASIQTLCSTPCSIAQSQALKGVLGCKTLSPKRTVWAAKP